MGAHGPADFLVHIVDPNRLVEPNFVSTVIETRDDQSYDGVIERENASEVVLRNAAGTHHRVSNIKTRSSSGRSLRCLKDSSNSARKTARPALLYLRRMKPFRILGSHQGLPRRTMAAVFSSTPDNREDTISFRKYGLQTG